MRMESEGWGGVQGVHWQLCVKMEKWVGLLNTLLEERGLQFKNREECLNWGKKVGLLCFGRQTLAML